MQTKFQTWRTCLLNPPTFDSNPSRLLHVQGRKLRCRQRRDRSWAWLAWESFSTWSCIWSKFHQALLPASSSKWPTRKGCAMFDNADIHLGPCSRRSLTGRRWLEARQSPGSPNESWPAFGSRSFAWKRSYQPSRECHATSISNTTIKKAWIMIAIRNW